MQHHITEVRLLSLLWQDLH